MVNGVTWLTRHFITMVTQILVKCTLFEIFISDVFWQIDNGAVLVAQSWMVSLLKNPIKPPALSPVAS